MIENQLTPRGMLGRLNKVLERSLYDRGSGKTHAAVFGIQHVQKHSSKPFVLVCWTEEQAKHIRQSTNGQVHAIGFESLSSKRDNNNVYVFDHHTVEELCLESYKFIEGMDHQIKKLLDETRNKMKSSLAGKTVEIISGDFKGSHFVVEDYWDNIDDNRPWKEHAHSNPACINYLVRAVAHALPMDDDVLYGKIGAMGHLIHRNEIGNVV